MDFDWSAEVVKALISAAVGFLLAVGTVRLQARHKTIAYTTSGTPLLRLEQANKKLTVTVDKSMVTGASSDAGVQEEVSTAHAHEISFKNVGNDVAEDMNVRIELDSTARIIDFSTSLKDPAPEAAIDAEGRNILTVKLKYLNPKEVFKTYVVTTSNLHPGKYKIAVAGKGISVNKRYGVGYAIIMLFLPFALLCLAGLSDGSLLAYLDAWFGWQTMAIVPLLGGELSTAVRVDWPLSHLVLAWGCLAVVSFYVVLKFVRITSFRLPKLASHAE